MTPDSSDRVSTHNGSLHFPLRFLVILSRPSYKLPTNVPSGDCLVAIIWHGGFGSIHYKVVTDGGQSPSNVQQLRLVFYLLPEILLYHNFFLVFGENFFVPRLLLKLGSLAPRT